MKGAWRATEIRRRVEASGFVGTRQLASDLEVDVSTIRRDLSRLARSGLVRRTHGGAMLADGTRRHLGDVLPASDTYDLPYRWREREEVQSKRAIGEHAAALVGDGDSLVLDSGSTTFEVARALGARRGLSVVTNDVHIAHELAKLGHVRLFVTGGQLLDSVFTLAGPAAVESLAGLRVDLAFLGADAVDAGAGVTNRNAVEVPLKRAMVAAAARSVLVADSTKFARRAVAAVCGIETFDVIVTDDRIAPDVAARYGPRLVTVAATGATGASPPGGARGAG